MRTVPARIQRVDGSVEDVVAVEHDGGTELVEPATLSTGDSITFTVRGRMSFGRAGDGLHLTDRQALALEFEAVIDEVTVAEVRRRAISELADRLLADPAIGGCVREVMRFRAREIGVGAAGLRLVEGAGDNG